MRRRIAAIAAGAGALFWAVKAASILATGWQPPLLFETAPVFFALASAAMADQRGPRVIAGAALLCALLAAGAFAGDLPSLAGPALGLAMLGVVASLIWHGAIVRARTRLPLVLGIATVPAVLVGGALSILDERLLEVPILGLAVAWGALGVQVWREAKP